MSKLFYDSKNKIISFLDIAMRDNYLSQLDWIMKDGFIKINYDSHVSENKIVRVCEVVSEFLRKNKLNFSVEVSKCLIDDLILESKSISSSEELDDISRKSFSILLKNSNVYKKIKPCLDIVIVSERMTSGWGITSDALILFSSSKINDSETSKKLISHELYHALGLYYSDDIGGNCTNSNCLMTFSLNGNNLCSKCKNQLHLILRKLNP